VKLGLVSDVHGNRHALEAVVADGAAQGVDEWWALGDLVAIGPEPVRTLELLAELPGLRAIAGNTERYVLTGDRPPPHAADVVNDPVLFRIYDEVLRSFAWTAGAMAATGWSDWLVALPAELRTTLPDGTTVLAVHAQPGRDDGPGITPHRDEDALRQDLATADASIVFAGHTHQPTDRWIDDIRAVNLGSVSNPVTDDARASYVVVHADRHGHGIEHRRVAYDVDGFLATLARSRHPAAGHIESFHRGVHRRPPISE